MNLSLMTFHWSVEFHRPLLPARVQLGHQAVLGADRRGPARLPGRRGRAAPGTGGPQPGLQARLQRRADQGQARGEGQGEEESVAAESRCEYFELWHERAP